MQATTFIGNLRLNDFPDLSAIERFFKAYSEDEWAEGSSGASFTIYGIDGTEDKEPFKDRIDVSLAVYDHPEFGMCLLHDKTGGGFGEHFVSLGDTSRLFEMTEDRGGELISVGMFIPPERAWLAVQDFIIGKGARSSRVTWANQDDLPAQAFPPPH